MKMILLAGALLPALLSPALSEEKGEKPPEAARGSATGYAVPTAHNGVAGTQAGANWTSKSGNTNLGGYTSGDANGGYEGGARATVHY